MKSKRASKKVITADDIIERLSNDDKYEARLEELEHNRQKRIAKYREDALPLVAELIKAGFNIDSISDLLSKNIIYRDAIPILIKWLPNIENEDVKEDIVRTLSVPWSRSIASPILISEFRKASSNILLQWAIANAISVVADDSSYNDIVELVQDKRYGKSREMLAIALGNMKNSNVVQVLIKLLNDDEVAGHAIIALGMLKAKEAQAEVERFLTHPKSWVRKEAARSIKRFNE